MWNPVKLYGEELGMVVVRAVYGLCTGLVLSILAALGYIASALQALPIPRDAAPYLGFVFAAILYLPSIAIAKVLGVRNRFNAYLRGSTVYLAILVIVHALVCSL